MSKLTVSPVRSGPAASKYVAIVGVLILAEIVSAFELSMMYVALPTLIVDFEADPNTVAWVVTAYLLVSASCAALGGRLGDMYGRKKVLMVALSLAAVGSLISLIGGSLVAVIIGRGVQGAAGAVMGLAFGLAREHVKSDKAAIGLSMIGASALVAGSLGAFISGFVIDAFSWHGIFIFAAVLAVVGVIAVSLVIPRDSGAYVRQPLDVVGAVLLPIAVSCVLIGVSSAGGGVGFGSARVLSLIGAGALVAAVWVVWELRVKNPVINIRMFKNRHIAVAMIATFIVAVGPIGGSTISMSLIQQYPSPPLTEVGLGLTPTLAGLISACTAFVGFAASPLGGVIARKIGARVAFTTGIALVTVPIIGFMLSFGNLIAFVVLASIVSVGTSLFFGALPNVLFEATPESHSSEVTGANTMIRNIGQSVATAIAAYILALHFDPAVSMTQAQGFNVALTFCLVLGAIAVAVSLLLSRKPKPWVPVVGVGAENAIQSDAVDMRASNAEGAPAPAPASATTEKGADPRSQ